MTDSTDERHFDLRDMQTNSDDRVNRRGHVLTGVNYKSVVDQLIEEAQERGDFDNLPGKGKPLNIDDNPFAGDMQMAYKMLKDNDFTLPWIHDRKRMQDEVDELRSKMSHQVQLFGPQVIAMARGGQQALAERRWAALNSQWIVAIEDINRRIKDVNYSIPVRKLELLTLALDIELTRLGVKPTLAEMLDATESHDSLP